MIELEYKVFNFEKWFVEILQEIYQKQKDEERIYC